MKRNLVDYAVAEKMYLAGSPLADIASRFGVKNSTISGGLTLRGVPRRRDQKLRRVPPTVELAYIAGLFDGEGSINISLGRSGSSHQYWLQVTVTNTDERIIRYLRDCFGVGHIFLRKSTREHARPCWRWACCAADAAHVLVPLQPFLRIKAEVCKVALEFQAQMIRGKRTTADRARQEELRVRSMRLNRGQSVSE